MSEKICMSCACWRQVRGQGPGVPGIPGPPPQGECRRYAPHPTVGTGHTHVLWPITAAAEGCGEWTPQRTPQ